MQPLKRVAASVKEARIRAYQAIALAASLGLTAIGVLWAHGVDELASGDEVVTDPAVPDKTNETLLPKSLDQAARKPAAAVLDQMKMWGVGQHVTICFVDPAPAAMRQRIARAASEWTKWANLVFDFGPSPDDPQMCEAGKTYDITIGFKGSGASSYVGTDSRHQDPSMVLGNMDDPQSRVAQDDREFKRIVLHEFGHAIGLDHEHQSPAAQCSDQIDWPAAENYYKVHMGWSAQDVHDNLETLPAMLRLAKEALKISGFDKTSIMQYSLPPEIFKDGRQAPCFTTKNYDLSPTDKKWVAGLYPERADGQVAVKKAVLTTLDKSFKDGGVPDDERKAAIAKIAETFSLTLNQENTAGRDVNATTIQNLEQNSSGANSQNIGTINGNVTFGAPAPR
jgi:hypothetical protein